jgi:hypothetical protein
MRNFKPIIALFSFDVKEIGPLGVSGGWGILCASYGMRMPSYQKHQAHWQELKRE